MIVLGEMIIGGIMEENIYKGEKKGFIFEIGEEVVGWF